MIKKIKSWLQNPDRSEPWWNIRALLLQPYIPTKSIEFVKACGASHSGESENGKYLYYWIGDFKSGYQVKVRRSI